MTKRWCTSDGEHARGQQAQEGVDVDLGAHRVDDGDDDARDLVAGTAG